MQQSRNRFAGVAVLFVLGVICSVGAHAQATRTWVSGVGDDVNPCSRTAPCKTFAGAISKTATGGVIDVLDSAGFGAVTITKSITIEGTGSIGGILSAGTNGIIVNDISGAAVVVIRDVSIDGFGTGTNGIRFLAGASLALERVSIQNVLQHGVDFANTMPASLLVSDSFFNRTGMGTPAAGSTFAAINIAPSSAANVATVALDRVKLANGREGLWLNGPVLAQVRDSAAFGNSGSGFVASSTTNAAQLTIESSSSHDNSGNGVLAAGSAAVVIMGNSAISANGVGLQATGGGTTRSFGNNRIAGNTVDGAPSATVAQK